MKILHTADWHVGKRIGRFDRTEEYRAAIAEVAGIADAHGADLVLHSGDLFDRAFPPVDVLRLAFEGLVALTAGGTRPVVVIAGNHDSPALFEALAPFFRGHGIHLVGEIKPPEENVLMIETANGNAVVSCFPFLREGRAFHAFENPDSQYSKYADRLRRISEAYSNHARTLAGSGAVELLVAHFLVGGVAVHGHGARRGERELHMGEAYAASPQALPAGPQYVAMGHVHAPQPVPGALVPAHYAGSLLQMDFGEAGEDKRVLVVEVEPGLPAKVVSVPVEAGRPLLRPNGAWADILATDGVYESYLDLTVQTAGPDPGLSDRVRAEFEWCVNVRADYPRIEPGVNEGAARSLPERYADYYVKAEGTEPPAELVGMFSELLEEVENAPLELRLRNFRSYFGEGHRFDFRDRRLIGIVGPIGAGKSTILDAISFALYGRTPRVGRDTRTLIHQRANNCAVELRFEIDGQIWEAVRNLRRQGQAQHALYRYETDDVSAEAVEKILQERSVGERVEELLGLDYAAFSRSVLLAQGEFDRFLRADAAERDKVLKGVFGLDRVDRIRELAKTRSREVQHELELLAVHLQHVEVARSELPEQRRALLEMGERIALLEKAEPKLSDLAAQLAQAEAELSSSTEKLDQLHRLAGGLPQPDLAEGLEEAARSSSADRAERAAVMEEYHELVVRAEQALREPEFVAMLDSIDGARELLVRLSEARKSRSAIEARMGEESKRAASARARAAEAEDKRLQAESALAKALAQLERDRQGASEADAAAHAARHADMAANLRRGLHAGDACPVCGQIVEKLAPASPTSDLEKAEASATKARAALDRSIDAHTSAVAEQKGALKAEEERGVQANEAETQVERTEAEVARAKSEETEIGGELSAILGEGDPEEVLAGRRVEAEARSRAAEDARAKREEARRLHDLAIQAEQQSAKAVAEALSRLTVLAAGLAMESETEGLEVGALASRVRAEWELQSGQAKLRQQQAAATIESARAGVAGILDELGLAPGQFERALAEAKAEAGMLERQVMVAEALVEGSEGDLANQASLIARNDLLGRVASDLTDARFVRFLLDEERRTLAGIGSVHFQLLSSGRYRFTDDGDFMVVDQSSADAIRRADSLSGGETFLASLGLALGLAETVGREGGRLDAFFLDEGFGTLDAEHLDLAMEGIEALVNDRRLVIVVSHVEGVRSRIDDLIVLDRDALTGDSIVRAGAAAG